MVDSPKWFQVGTSQLETRNPLPNFRTGFAAACNMFCNSIDHKCVTGGAAKLGGIHRSGTFTVNSTSMFGGDIG